MNIAINIRATSDSPHAVQDAVEGLQSLLPHVFDTVEIDAVVTA